MVDLIDNGVMAGMSAAMAYWLFAGMVCMGFITWRYRGRFANWGELSVRDKADAILSVSLFGFLAHATFHRARAAYSFAVYEWDVSALTLLTAPLYLLLAMASVAGLLWWMCLEIFGLAQHERWWWLLILTGAWLGAGVSWRY